MSKKELSSNHTTTTSKNSKSKDVRPVKDKKTGTDLIKKGFYYGDKTHKWMESFNIGEEKMPRQLIKSIGTLKKAATMANEELKLISKDKAMKIIKATDEVINGDLDDSFPLTI